jgi:ABC-type Fe3+/spermidine/putrescine transport system ATPase subunit
VQVRAVQNGRTTVVLSGRDILVPSRKGVDAGSHAEISLRPERLRLTRTAEDGNCLPGTVVDSVFMGACTRFSVQVSEGHVLLAEQQNQTHGSVTEFNPGETVWVNWGPTSATLLPGATPTR